VSVIVLGCTELPILLPGGEYVARNGCRATLVDPTDVLARTCIAYAMSFASRTAAERLKRDSQTA